ncbi:MAG: hypothetical protein SFX73_24065 [Kofleriaceae bacterium]|nr:hypothetical protein [Kofleriaceae bacterium]
MQWRFVALASLLAVGAAHADDLDTVRVLGVDVPRSQLQRASSALSLIQRMAEGGWEAAKAELAKSPDGALLLGYLSSNAPRLGVVDLALNAGAGTTEGGSAGELTATLGARVVGDYCDVASASLAVRASYAREGDLFGGEARAAAGLCLWRGLFVGPESKIEPDQTWFASLFPLRARAELALNASPRFTSSRNQPRRRYSEARYGFTVDGLRFMPTDPRRGVTFIYAGFENRYEWANLFEGDYGFELIGGFGFVRFFRTREPWALADRAIDILDIRLHGTRFDESVALIELYPLRIRGLGFGGNHVLFDADLGIGLSGGEISASSCLQAVGCTDDVIMTGANVADIATAVGRGGVSVGTRANGGGALFARTLDSNMLGQLTVEDRITGWYQQQRDGFIVRGDVFGGNAQHFLDVDARGRERFVGTGIDAQVEVRPQLWLGAQVDGVRVFARDAVLDGRVAGSGVRAFATLAWTFDLTRRKIELPVPSMQELAQEPAPDAAAPPSEPAPEEPHP